MADCYGRGTGRTLLFSGRLELAQQSEGIGQLLPWIVGAAFGYSGYQYIQARNISVKLKVREKSKVLLAIGSFSGI